MLPKAWSKCQCYKGNYLDKAEKLQSNLTYTEENLSISVKVSTAVAGGEMCWEKGFGFGYKRLYLSKVSHNFNNHNENYIYSHCFRHSYRLLNLTLEFAVNDGKVNGRINT